MLGLKRKVLTTKNTLRNCSQILVKATSHKDKKFHFDQYGHGKSGEAPENTSRYTHETHEKMYAWHVPDEDKKKQLRKDAHEQAKNGSTKGHVSSHALLTVLDDFKERVSDAEDDPELLDQVMSEFHDWLMYVHAQHKQHGLEKDTEFRRAYTDAHTFYTMVMAEHDTNDDDETDEDND